MMSAAESIDEIANQLKAQPEIALTWSSDSLPSQGPLALGRTEPKETEEILLSPYAPRKLVIPDSGRAAELGLVPTKPLPAEVSRKNAYAAETFFYISDIHLEHQIPGLIGASLPKARKLIWVRVEQMVMSVPKILRIYPLLIAGDIADNPEYAELFFEALADYYTADGVLDGSRPRWDGHIFFVLGNHDLWNLGTSRRVSADETFVTFQNIADSISDSCVSPSVLLENDVWLHYSFWEKDSVLLEEDAILNMPDEDLADLCKETEWILLGGMGFAGKNPTFNANMEIYGESVSRQEEIAWTERFRTVHDKLARCTGKSHVVVLTHMPFWDWSSSRPIDGWVYVNGHTHKNTLYCLSDGGAIYADNQVGYAQKAWSLKSFSIGTIHDPLESLLNGIHEITKEQYRDFNAARGILMTIKRKGQIFAIKQDGHYAFFLKNENGKLYLLEGGSVHVAEHNLEYYSRNLSRYVELVKSEFARYRNAMDIIAQEVKVFGGWGSVHGCIVDIDFFHHLFLDPYEGRIRPYYALSTDEWVEYDTLRELLAESDFLAYPMLPDYERAVQASLIPYLSGSRSRELAGEATSCKRVLPKGEYKVSRIMRTIQYLLDQEVVRIWNDGVLDVEDGEVKALPETTCNAAEKRLCDKGE